MNTIRRCPKDVLRPLGYRLITQDHRHHNLSNLLFRFFLDIVNMHYPHNAWFLVSLFLFNLDYNLNYFVPFINLFQSCSTTYPRKVSAFCVGHSLKSVRIRSFSGSFFPVLGMSTDQRNSEYGHFTALGVGTVYFRKHFSYSVFNSFMKEAVII